MVASCLCRVKGTVGGGGGGAGEPPTKQREASNELTLPVAQAYHSQTLIWESGHARLSYVSLPAD